MLPAPCVGGLALIMALVSPSALLAQESGQSCDVLAGQLGASYTVFSSSSRKTVALEFWRSGATVLYKHPDRQTADQWTLTPNGYVKPTRYFIADQRAIEYDAFDINGGKGSKDWESRSQWISEKQIESMNFTGSEGVGCQRIESYEYTPVTKDGKPDTFSRMTLSWMPELKLVQRYELRSTGQLGQRRVTQWQMEKLYTDPAQVSSAMSSFKDFGATDYADIGDNESDPFLMKMIKLGFTFNANSNADEHAVRANFENCLSTMSRQLESLLLKQTDLLTETLSTIVASIRTCRQKLRPNRSYP